MEASQRLQESKSAVKRSKTTAFGRQSESAVALVDMTVALGYWCFDGLRCVDESWKICIFGDEADIAAE